MYVFSNGQENIKLKKEAISEILVTDTDLESGAEASDVEDKFVEEEEEEEEKKKKKKKEKEEEGRRRRRRRTTTAAATATTIIIIIITITTTTPNRSQTTSCNMWQITNVRTTSRKENKYPSFCWSSKSCEKK